MENGAILLLEALSPSWMAVEATFRVPASAAVLGGLQHPAVKRGIRREDQVLSSGGSQSVLCQSDRGLRQCPAVQRGAGSQVDRLDCHKGPLDVRRGADLDTSATADLPEDIPGLCPPLSRTLAPEPSVRFRKSGISRRRLSGRRA